LFPAENVNREDLIFAYKESCARHATEPLQNVLIQLEVNPSTSYRSNQLHYNYIAVFHGVY